MGRILGALLFVVVACDRPRWVPPLPGEQPVQQAKPAEAPAGPASVTWRASSKDGAATLEQTQTGDSCQSRCTKNKAEAWAVDRCLSDKDDFVFITSDCAGAIVIEGKPPVEQPWSNTQVLFIYRRGEQAKSYFGAPMLAEPERMEGHYRWLKGEPRYLQNGNGISFEVLTGRETRLPFEEGVAVNEETYLNDKPSEPDPRPAYVDEYRRPPPTSYPPPSAGPPSAPAQAKPPRDPNRNRRIRVCTARGCTYEYVQAAPTLRNENGEGMVCRNEGEACGTNADCCGGNCSGGTCR